MRSKKGTAASRKKQATAKAKPQKKQKKKELPTLPKDWPVQTKLSVLHLPRELPPPPTEPTQAVASEESKVGQGGHDGVDHGDGHDDGAIHTASDAPNDAGGMNEHTVSVQSTNVCEDIVVMGNVCQPTISDNDNVNTNTNSDHTGNNGIEANAETAVATDNDAMIDNEAEINADGEANDAPPRLLPGPLIHQCSGTDIQLTKQATNLPNVAKEKGRFLIIFPGQLSLKGRLPQANAKTTATTAKAGDSAAAAADAEHNDVPKEDGKPDDKEDVALPPDVPKSAQSPKKATAAASSKSADAMISLGMLMGVATETPSLRVPFANQVLVFPGKKVETSTKFMVLSCSAKRRGTVTCKSLFSSAIILGEPKWEPMEERDKWNSAATSSLKPASNEVNQGSTHDDNNSGDTTTTGNDDVILHHFGGSNRSIDGVGTKRANSKNKRSTPSRKTPTKAAANRKRPTPSKLEFEEEAEEGAGDDVHSDSSVPLHSDNDASTDEDASDHGAAAAKKTKKKSSSTPRRATPRRSATKKIKYEESEEEQSEEEDEQAADETDDDDAMDDGE